MVRPPKYDENHPGSTNKKTHGLVVTTRMQNHHVRLLLKELLPFTPNDTLLQDTPTLITIIEKLHGLVREPILVLGLLVWTVRRNDDTKNTRASNSNVIQNELPITTNNRTSVARLGTEVSLPLRRNGLRHPDIRPRIEEGKERERD